jgi:hypothetical protein
LTRSRPGIDLEHVLERIPDGQALLSAPPCEFGRGPLEKCRAYCSLGSAGIRPSKVGETSGSANVGFWFFQDDVAPISGGTFRAMSQENVEIVRRAIEAYEREGLDGSLRYYDPEIEWTSTDAYMPK